MAKQYNNATTCAIVGLLSEKRNGYVRGNAHMETTAGVRVKESR
jgi:hypothetical protein